MIANWANCLAIREWFYPLMWWSYILAVDGLIYLIRGNSLIISRTRSFLIILPWSVTIWLIFELFNLRIKNWYYINVTPIIWQRWLGYCVSYATVLPGIFETMEFLETIGLYRKFSLARKGISERALKILLAVGILFLVLPVLLPRYCFPLVWLGFIFLLEPTNIRLSGTSLLKQGNLSKILLLFSAGLICGILWEFFNYWARTKWVYALPYFQWLKIFEMPLLGYLGFLPFAWGCYLMYNFIITTGYGYNWEKADYQVSRARYIRPGLIITTIILILVFWGLMFWSLDTYTVKTFLTK